MTVQGTFPFSICQILSTAQIQILCGAPDVSPGTQNQKLRLWDTPYSALGSLWVLHLLVGKVALWAEKLPHGTWELLYVWILAQDWACTRVDL